jgi:branched-chain amino acid transport system substrate-binding protein
MKKRFLSAGLAVVMAASLTACGGSDSASTTAAAAGESKAEGESAAAGESSAAADGAVFKIGGIGPVTGGAAVYGLAVQHGAEVAVKEINEAGGINGAQIEFQFQDDEHDAEKSVNAYNTLKDWGIQALVGTTTSAPCIAVADKTAADNMFQITPSGSAVECAANPNVFRVCYSDPAQGTASAKYIGEHKLASKVAVIYDSSDVYSSGIYEKFAQEAPNQGLEVVDAEAFTADSNKDFSTQLQKAKESGAELVFLPIYYTEASLILQQANTMGYAPQFFGCDGMDGILQVENFDVKLAEGLMLLTPFAADATDDLTVNFVKSYEEAYGETPIQFAADAYDAVYIIKAAMEEANVTPDMSAPLSSETANIACPALVRLINAIRHTMITIQERMVAMVSPVIFNWPSASFNAGIFTTEVNDFVSAPKISSATFWSR